MTTTLTWLVHPTILLLEDEGHVDATEVLQSSQQLMEMIKEAPGKVHIVVDLKKLERINIPNPLKMPQALEIMRHPNRGWVVVTGSTNAIMNYWLETFSRIANLSYKVLPTVEEAKQFLQAMDSIASERTQKNELAE